MWDRLGRERVSERAARWYHLARHFGASPYDHWDRDMRTWPATNLLIRLDPRARGALQQQIYAGIRRAILDGVIAPGTVV